MARRSQSRCRRSILLCCLVPLLVLHGGMAAAQDAVDDPLTEEERAWVGAQEPLRFAPRPELAPFSLTGPEGEKIGLELDLMNRISRNLDIDFEVIDVHDWAAAKERLRDGAVDAIAPVANTDQNVSGMELLDPHAQVALVLFIDDDRTYPNTTSLSGRRVAAMADAPTTERFAQQYPDITVVPVQDIADGFDAVQRGRVAAFLTTNTAGGHYLQDTGRSGFVTIHPPVDTIRMHWAVQENATMLAGILQQGMDSIAPGERQRLFAYWTGFDISVPPEGADEVVQVPPFARDIISITLIVALAAVSWGVALKRQVRTQTKELRRSRDALGRYKDQLEETVRARTQALEETAEDLRRSNRELERFAYVASHDLQEPLRMVHGYLDLLERRYSQLLDKDGEEFLGYALDGADRMTVLIQDLLELSRIGTRPLRQDEVSLDKVVDRTLHDLGARLAETDAKVAAESLPKVQGDATYLQQLMQNLISNAIKFQRPGVRPEVRILAAPSGRGMVGIMVADNGIGMDPEKTAEIFEPFRRLHHRAEYPGTGIGLAISRRIVELHGGTIHAESDGPGTGTRFVFTLPLVEEERPEAEADAPTAADLGTDGRQAARASRTLHERLLEDLEDEHDAPTRDASRAAMATRALDLMAETPDRVIRRGEDRMLPSRDEDVSHDEDSPRCSRGHDF